MIPSLTGILAAVTALAGATLLTVVATPQLRRLALASGFVDQPAARKSHVQPVPYLGGVAIIAGTLFGLVVSGRLSAPMAAVAVTAALLGSVGLLDDDRSLPASARLMAQAGAAIVVVAVGIRAQVTGVVILDVVLTIVWIVAITNAVNFLDNMDGLAAGIAVAASSAVFALAVANGQGEVARLAGAVAGACLGFLVYNRRPASIFMGDAGSMFLGFLLAVAVIGVDPALVPPTSFVVPVLLLALPVLDISSVVVGRLRRGRPVGQAGKDHLSHRLVAKGLSPGMAVIALVGAELALASLAVLAGRGLASLPVVAVASGLIVLAVMLSVASAPVYHEPIVGVPRRFGLAVLSVACTAAGLVAAPSLLDRDASPSDQQAISTTQGWGSINDRPVEPAGQVRSPGDVATVVEGSIPQVVAGSGVALVFLTLLATTRRRLREASASDKATRQRIPDRVAAVLQRR